MLMVSFAALTALVTMAFWVGFIKLIVSFEALCRLQRLQSLHLTELGKRQAMFILMISGDYCSWGFFVNGWSRGILRFGVIRIHCASGHRVTLRTLTIYIIHSEDQQWDLYIPMSEIYCSYRWPARKPEDSSDHLWCICNKANTIEQEDPGR